MEWHEQNVTLLLNKDSEVYKAAEAAAAKHGVRVEDVISSAVMMHGDLAVQRWLERK